MSQNPTIPARRSVAARRFQLRRGFTLIEAALVLAIISFGVLAMLQLLAAGTVSNSEGAEMTTAMNLAKNVREMCVGMHCVDPTTPTNWGAEPGETLATYDDIDDLAGRSFSPPIDARRTVLTELDNWVQSISVVNVDADRLTTVVPNGSSPAYRITCVVTNNGREVYRMSWVAFDTN